MLIRRSIIIALAFIGATLVFISIILITGTLTLIARHPSDFLPQDKTLALFNNMTDIEISEYEAWLPVLQKRLQTPEKKTTAIVSFGTEEKDNQIIEFIWRGLKAAPSKYWPYEVHSSAQTLEILLVPRLQALTQKPEYREFSRRQKPDAPWVYIQRNALSQSGTLLQSITQNLIFQNANTITFSKEDDNTFVIGTVGSLNSSLSDVPAPLQIKNGSILSVSISNPADIFNTALSSLHHHNKTFLSAFIRTELQKALGSSISEEFDILPLFNKDTLFTIGKTASGKTIFAVSGYAIESELLTKTLDKLHEGRKDTLPFIDILEQRLDNLFAIRTLRSTSHEFIAQEELLNDWSITVIQEEDSEFGFFSAQKNKAFVLSNNRQEFLSHLANKPDKIKIPTTSTLLKSTLRSSGVMDTTAMKELIDDLLPDEIDGEPLPFFRNLSGSILWTLEERGAVSEWRFEKQ